ncbi:unnamed protein product [Cuscuta campestris]|uniref:Uncharacterized protein n=1 Tax=Cuscuta campestris TaxID=132261 RepID=A0A484KWK1_9ASTE|nr:unnamed protein product [Cuscuta campestris]
MYQVEGKPNSFHFGGENERKPFSFPSKFLEPNMVLVFGFRFGSLFKSRIHMGVIITQALELKVNVGLYLKASVR